ncbi:MAG: Asp-tRNA(Asn)/Glu-tRNA(Gln) amidotransferase subunit GatB [Candidatus Woesearchaeota archaeon]
MNSDIVIGLEIHVELATETKLFCSCARTGSEEPNTRTCPVCLGHPGSKPVLNRKVLDYALRLCLALDCTISPELIFSRKSYFYPDMAKNYQITQYEDPLGRDGKLQVAGKDISITRVHIEEDPASLVHGNGHVLVDYNRSGDPLCEIVTGPDLTSPEEAREFMRRLIEVIRYLDIFDIDSCLIKADVNVSIKESGYKRAEIKNITGFKEIERALYYEVSRQKKAVAENEELVVETRGWDPEGFTYSMRKKESEEDYGYILDPDLTITDITEDKIEEVKASMPELAQSKVTRYVKDLGIDKEDAQVIASDRLLAEIFESVSKDVDPVLSARWIRRELLRVLNYNKLDIRDIKIDANHISELLQLIEKKKITENTGKEIIQELIITPFDIHQYIKDHGLEAVSDQSELQAFCKEAIDENPQAVAEFREGKEKALNFLVGQVMKKTKGKASPAEVNKLIKELI